MPKIFSDLNLNGSVPPRVRPALGDWGPEQVPSTKLKKRVRRLVPVAFAVALLVVFLFGWYVYYQLTGQIGFGLDDPTPR